MRKPYLRAVVTSALAVATVMGPASPASANHTGFSKAEYEVAETAGYVELSIDSAGGFPPGSGQFDYYTANLSAFAGADYEQTSGTVTTEFPADCGCSIRVPITNDELFEGEEQFEVRLNNFRGWVTPARTTAVVRILDDDPKPSSNSISTGRSNQHISANSSGSSPLRSPSPHLSGEDSVGLAESPASDGGLVIADQNRTREDVDQLVPQGGRKVGRASLPFVALATVLVTGLGLLLWIRFRRAAPS